MLRRLSLTAAAVPLALGASGATCRPASPAPSASASTATACRDTVPGHHALADGQRHEGNVTHNLGGRAAVVYRRDGTFSR